MQMGNKSTDCGNAVRIMSIHKSKGLEFPIVILSDLSRKFNTEDQKQQILTHPTMYCATNILDSDTEISYPSIAKKAIAMRIKE